MILIWKSVILLTLSIIGKTDWDTKKIPNKWTALLAVCCFLSGHLIIQMPLKKQLLGMLAVSGFLLFLVFLKPGAIGGGDIKLMAASGLLLGVKENFAAFYVGLLGAAAYIFVQFLRGRIRRGSEFPLGPFLCAGIAAVLITLRS